MRLLASFRLALAISVLSMPVMGCKQRATRDPKPDKLIAPAAPKTLWVSSHTKDEMTDEVSYGISDSDNHGNALLIACYPQSHVYIFQSDLTLSAIKSTGKLEYRFDSEKPVQAIALLTGNTATIGSPLPFQKAVKRDDPLGIMAVSGLGFESDLLQYSARQSRRPTDHSYMTVRLSSVDGQTVTFRLEITGIEKALSDLDKKCGYH